MRGTSCTKFTLWICSFSYSMTVWLSRTHTWHKQTEFLLLLLFVINNRDNLLFTQRPLAHAVQLKMSVRFYAMKFDTPKKLVFISQPTCLLSLFLSLPFFHQESLWHSRLLHFSRCSSIETEFSVCSSLVEYSKTAQLHLHNETSLCQCEGINTQWSHCDQWHTSCIYKCYFGKCCRGYQGGGFFLLLFFSLTVGYFWN